MNKVFVYGTLKKGNPLRGLEKIKGAEFLGEALTSDYDYVMRDLGPFPAVSSPGFHQVSGEVWNVTDDVLELIDIMEGHPDFYCRRQVETTLGTAWMYLVSDDFLESGKAVSPAESGVLCWS
jgi:gamma-glutamylaminecyclotransferase